jgi:hypothetical protein
MLYPAELRGRRRDDTTRAAAIPPPEDGDRADNGRVGGAREESAVRPQPPVVGGAMQPRSCY